CLLGAPVGKLGHDCGVDVYGDHTNPGRKHIPDTDRVEHRPEADDYPGVHEQPCVLFLGLYQVHLSIRQRAIITDRAGQDEWYNSPNAFVHDSGAQYAGINSTRDRAAAVDRIDRSHMVFMTLFDRDAA